VNDERTGLLDKQNNNSEHNTLFWRKEFCAQNEYELYCHASPFRQNRLLIKEKYDYGVHQEEENEEDLNSPARKELED
jgi:hypothetical protein